MFLLGIAQEQAGATGFSSAMTRFLTIAAAIGWALALILVPGKPWPTSAWR